MKSFTRKYSVKPNDSVNKTFRFNRISTFSFHSSYSLLFFFTLSSRIIDRIEGIILHDSISISYINLTLNSYCLPRIYGSNIYILFAGAEIVSKNSIILMKFVKNKICMLRYINIECNI